MKKFFKDWNNIYRSLMGLGMVALLYMNAHYITIEKFERFLKEIYWPGMREVRADVIDLEKKDERHEGDLAALKSADGRHENQLQDHEARIRERERALRGARGDGASLANPSMPERVEVITTYPPLIRRDTNNSGLQVLPTVADLPQNKFGRR